MGVRPPSPDASVAGFLQRSLGNILLSRGGEPIQCAGQTPMGESRVRLVVRSLVSLLSIGAIADIPAAATQAIPGIHDGKQLYDASCAACHGEDGRGVEKARLGFDIPIADFSDCNFATREPDSDWFAVTHDGGPARGFDRMMPAFGDALDDEEIFAILRHIRSFCTDDSWPRGELNLPRAMFTEKAYPEDEWVWTTGVNVERPGAVSNEFIYETRFGARNQLEFVIPFEFREREGGSWHGGLGDIAVGIKRVLYADLPSGSILSIAGEVILPTGNFDRGFGAGVTRFEPFASFGLALPAEMFFQAQAGAELPTSTERAQRDAFWRGAIGKSFTEGRFGRTWSPMIEVLGARPLHDEEARTEWDVVPQFHVTLNRRQHVMANAAIRVPLTDRESRSTEILVFLLLDWFDGGFFEGW